MRLFENPLQFADDRVPKTRQEKNKIVPKIKRRNGTNKKLMQNLSNRICNAIRVSRAAK